MPWQPPSLRQVRQMVRDDIATTTGGAQAVGNTVLRVMADAMAGLARLTLTCSSWLSLPLLPDTAEEECADRHGQIWLTNADGALGRKKPTFGQGTVQIEGVTGINVPLGTELVSAEGQHYEPLDWAVLGV